MFRYKNIVRKQKKMNGEWSSFCLPWSINEVDYKGGIGKNEHQTDLKMDEEIKIVNFFWGDCFIQFFQLTRILPVPVWPEMSSPAQSLASDIKSPACENVHQINVALFWASSHLISYSLSKLEKQTNFCYRTILTRASQVLPLRI